MKDTEGEKSPALERLTVVVHGRVQGVGFRYFTQHQASALGLTGAVSNEWDETVRVVAEGEREALLRLLGYLKRGPHGAWVERMDENWGPVTGEFRHFRIGY